MVQDWFLTAESANVRRSMSDVYDRVLERGAAPRRSGAEPLSARRFKCITTLVKASYVGIESWYLCRRSLTCASLETCDELV